MTKGDRIIRSWSEGRYTGWPEFVDWYPMERIESGDRIQAETTQLEDEVVGQPFHFSLVRFAASDDSRGGGIVLSLNLDGVANPRSITLEDRDYIMGIVRATLDALVERVEPRYTVGEVAEHSDSAEGRFENLGASITDDAINEHGQVPCRVGCGNWVYPNGRWQHEQACSKRQARMAAGGGG